MEQTIEAEDVLKVAGQQRTWQQSNDSPPSAASHWRASAALNYSDPGELPNPDWIRIEASEAAAMAAQPKRFGPRARW